jgi:hypothetical protein
MTKKKKENIPEGRLQAVIWFMTNHTWKFVGIISFLVLIGLIVSVGWVFTRDKKGNLKLKEIKKPELRLGKPK